MSNRLAYNKLASWGLGYMGMEKQQRIEGASSAAAATLMVGLEQSLVVSEHCHRVVMIVFLR